MPCASRRLVSSRELFSACIWLKPMRRVYTVRWVCFSFARECRLYPSVLDRRARILSTGARDGRPYEAPPEHSSVVRERISGGEHGVKSDQEQEVVAITCFPLYSLSSQRAHSASVNQVLLTCPALPCPAEHSTAQRIEPLPAHYHHPSTLSSPQHTLCTYIIML